VTTDVHLQALRHARQGSFWLDAPGAPEPAETLVGRTVSDLVVVGAGYTGLWTALLAKRRHPALDVVVLEGQTAGWAASGRNGGFCSSSITHGVRNAIDRWPHESHRLARIGLDNLADLERDVAALGIDCEWERTGELAVATAPWQAEELHAMVAPMHEHGHDVVWFDPQRVRAEVSSPTYLGGLWDRNGVALVHPAKLAWGLRRACEDAGVRFHESTLATGLEHDPSGVTVRTGYGVVEARHAALATNAFPPLLREVRHRVVPVYDYALVTEPLSRSQLASVGWAGRQGISDSANQFHYYRLTADDRILFGGYDVVYRFNQQVASEHDEHPATFVTLARHFFQTFPQLSGVQFTHRWGGAIDTCARFTQFWGGSHDGSVAYVAGYTGLGVGASRFGAQVLLDRLGIGVDEQSQLRLSLSMVRSKPRPIPPEPLRFVGIRATQWSIRRADLQGGRRNLWLRALDAAGIGFDS
jgi:glycine/D-amino acid oxidase-like deaminating enzyme